jgi:hypothetical protein
MIRAAAGCDPPHSIFDHFPVAEGDQRLPKRWHSPPNAIPYDRVSTEAADG